MHLSLDSFKRINGNTLKVIACIIMLIDHIAAGIMLPVINKGLYPDSISFDQIEFIYRILRNIGRSAFPIFCFLLVEGFIYTHSRLRYALSLLIFAIISEPFYDLTFYCKEDPFNINFIEVLAANKAGLSFRCNVFVTLLIGLLTIWAADRAIRLSKELKTPLFLSYILAALATILGIFIAEQVMCDYHGYGIAIIAAFYFLRNLEPLNLAGGYLSICSFSTEAYSFPGFILLLFYNKKRGRKLGNLKYLFYAFYPVHIGLIYVLRCLMFG